MNMFNFGDFSKEEISKIGLLGKSHVEQGTTPTVLEMIRFSLVDEKLCNKLISIFETKLTEKEFRTFKSEYYASNNRLLLQNYLHSLQSATHEINTFSTFHSDKRKWISIAKQTTLRDYQDECVDQITTLLSQKIKPLLVLPTGAGKTKTIIHALRNRIDECEQPINILWIVHTKDLCLQAEEAIEKAWVESRNNVNHSNLWLNVVYGKGIKPHKSMFDSNPSFTIATPDSIESANWKCDLEDVFDLIICDEAHHGVLEQKRIFDLWPAAIHIGMTATPDLNTDSAIFNRLYDKMVTPRKFIHRNGGKDWRDTQNLLIKDAYLSDYRDIISKDLRHVANKIHLELKSAKWSNQPCSILGASELCKSMLKEGCNKILLFVDGVEQARAIAGILRHSRVNTTTVYGGLKQDERTSRINGFSAGHFEVLVSVDVLREGIDVPMVDGILIMRRGLTDINSPMFTQILGRGLRGPKSGGTKNCLVWHVT
jgi:superfamily II DNA or RNA helicase